MMQKNLDHTPVTKWTSGAMLDTSTAVLIWMRRMDKEDSQLCNSKHINCILKQNIYTVSFCKYLVTELCMDQVFSLSLLLISFFAIYLYFDS